MPSCLRARNGPAVTGWFCTAVSRLSKMIAKLKAVVLNGTLNTRSGCLSRPVSPKLAHEAVLAKPPYFDEVSAPHVILIKEAREG